ncbi:MAG: FG-GAP-like repeat-containing protein [Pirellulaceae bacterium]
MIVVCCVGCGSDDAVNRSAPEESAVSGENDVAPVRDLYAEAESRFQNDDLDATANLLMELLIQQPDHTKAKLLTARVEAGRKQLARALELIESITPKDRALRIEAATFEAQWAKELGDPIHQERALRSLIVAAPNEAAHAHELWKLFHRQGRTFEAAVVAEMLCRSGNAALEELESLVFRGQSFPRKLASDNLLSEHFDSELGIARWHFTKQELEDAEKVLRSSFQAATLSVPAMALYGRLLAETQQLEQFSQWYSACNEDVRQFDDYWSALGTYFVNDRQYEAAIGVLLQAVVLNSVDPVNYQRLALALDAVGRSEDAEACRNHGIQVRKTQNLLDNSDLNTQRAATATVMARQLIELSRPFEALEWSRVALPDNERRQRIVLAAKRVELAGMKDLAKMRREANLMELNPNDFKYQDALASLKNSSSLPPTISLVKRDPNSSLSDGVQFVLQDIAEAVGIKFQWFQAKLAKPDSIALYQSLGGGVGVIDFDLDGNPDLLFAQGASNPEAIDAELPVSTASNQMFRNQINQFENVTQQSGAVERNYSQGVAVGDVNQDGFPDLLIGNIGENRLLINCGDGTFVDASDQLQLDDQIADQITSSVAIGDVDSDGLPDLFVVNYIQRQGAFDPITLDQSGREIVKGPLSYFAEADQWYRNQGDGSFSGQEIASEAASNGTGLGIVLTDLDGRDGNEIFIGNDARANHLLVQSDGSLQDVANVQGVANGYFGSATACMGIAPGDFNRDGRIDLHVTNFLGEYDNLFLQSESGVFRDAAPSFQLHHVSAANLGFGTKASDVDRDGWLDLIIANGHISDQRHEGNPFKMRPLFLQSKSDGFQVASSGEQSNFFQADYWRGEYLGRAIATLDWNRDGTMDFVITHLDRPAALLNNATVSTGRSVQFELVGTRSERDAIGARISVETEQGEYRHWVTAGDGYLCSDEAVIDFGVGNANIISKVKVHWPSGEDQVFDDVAVGQRFLIIEGEDRLFEREDVVLTQ